MKKLIVKIVFALILLNLCALFYSCNEDVYNPKEKIKKIYSEMLPYHSKALAEEWIWEKNKLMSIRYYSGGRIYNTEYYTYDKKKLVKVEDEDGYYQISYDGTKYKKVEYYRRGGKLYATWEFSYISDKISTIIYTELFGIEFKTGFFATLIPKEINELAKKSTEKSSEPYISTFKYAYKGDNVSLITMEQEDSGEIFTITTSYNSYDNMLNPHYKRIEMASDQIVTSFVTSKNNPLEIRRVRSEDYERETLTRYSYKYEKKFPVEVEITHTIVGTDITVSCKGYYEYQ
jgi:hypothetical protein